jgi:hypothetical protein
MHISSKDLFAGVPIVRVRDAAKRLTEGFDATDFTAAGFTPTESEAILAEMAARSYTEHCPEGRLILSPIGEEFARSSAASRVSRSVAEKALAGLLSRVAEVNLGAEYIYGVSHAVVFGSFLGTGDLLGDLDVSVRKRAKMEHTPELLMAHRRATAGGRTFGDIIAQHSWPDSQVNLKLKNRMRVISLQPWWVFDDLVQKHNINYQVMFGDADTVFTPDPMASVN